MACGASGPTSCGIVDPTRCNTGGSMGDAVEVLKLAGLVFAVLDCRSWRRWSWGLRS